MISIAIPSKNEIFLQKTILDVLEKAKGDMEVFPILDGYEPPKDELVVDPRVHYVRLEPTSYSKKRHGINKVINEYATGEYVCWLDGHVMVAEGFDEVLARDCGDKMVLVPQRRRLDPFNWCEQIQDHRKPHIDYEHFLWDGISRDHGLHGFRWDWLSNERKDVPIDDIMTAQGSFFFMKKAWFQECGFMDLKYQGWGQEAEEIVMGSLLNGGRSCITKNTWYAHWHKGKNGRGFHLGKDELSRSYTHSYNFWVVEHKEFFIEHINKFPRQPHWPENWEEIIYKK